MNNIRKHSTLIMSYIFPDPTILTPSGVGSNIGSIQTATLVMTAADINALTTSNTAVLVPNPGVGFVIVPITVSVSLNRGVGASTFTGGGKKLIIQLGVPGTPAPIFLWDTSILDTAQTLNRLATGSIGSVGNFGNTSNYTGTSGRSLRIAAGAPYAGGTGSTVTFTCMYYLLTVP